MCTRIFWPDNHIAKVVARTMDWVVSDEPRLWALPAGQRRGGGTPGALEWESHYGSVVLSMYEAGTSDGINEAGLAAHALYLDEAQLADAPSTAAAGERAIANTLWTQWVLDSFSTVAEAVDGMKGLEIFGVPVRDQALLCHLALDDACGDSAVVEPLDGLTVHHDRSYTVMTNSPPFDEQLESLRRYQPFGGSEPLPGNILSADRFVRATYFLEHLPEPATYAEAVAGVVHIAGNVAVPPGAPYDDFGVYPTWWISAADLSAPTFYFWSRLSPSMIWVELDKLDLSAGAPVRVLDPAQPDLVGDVTAVLEAWNEPLPY